MPLESFPLLADLQPPAARQAVAPPTLTPVLTPHTGGIVRAPITCPTNDARAAPRWPRHWPEAIPSTPARHHRRYSLTS